MKKIFNKVLLLVLSVLMVTGLFAGCGETRMADIPESKITNPVFVMNNFENYRDLWRFVPSHTFGDISLNTDKNYVSNGEGSLKATIIGQTDYLAGEVSNSSMKAQTKDVLDYNVFGDDWSDFTYATLVSIDIYNPSPVTRQTAIQLHYNETMYSVPVWTDCPQGWTTVKCPIQREFIPHTIVDKATGRTAAKVEHISVIFEKDLTCTYTMYADNMCIFYATSEVEAVSKDLKADELCSFDEYWQFKEFSLSCYTPAFVPTAEWIQLPDEPERGGILKINTVDRSVGGSTGTDYPGIKIPNDCYTMFFNPETFDYDDNDEFCIDVKGPETNMIQSMYLEIYFSEFSKFTTKTFYFDVDHLGEWQTIRFSVAEMNTNRYQTYPWVNGQQITVEHVSYADARTGYFKDCKKINMTFRSSAGYVSEEILIDNFRMERVD